MRVLVLSHRVPYPPNKGEKIRTYHQIEYLLSCGHEVVVCALQHDAEDREYASALAESLGIEVFVEVARFRLMRLLAGLFTLQTLSVCNFRVARLQWRIDLCVDQIRPDAVLCTSSAMASYVFRNPVLNAAAVQKPALIMDFMDIDSDKWDQYRRLSWFPLSLIYRRESWLLSRYEKKINAHFSSCLFVSRNEKDMFLAQGVSKPERVFVVGNGVDMKSFWPIEETPDQLDKTVPINCTPNLVFIGVMDYLPNEDAMCWFVEKVWAKVRERWPAARLTIAGMSPSERVTALRNIPGIEVTGKVDSVLPYFHRANVFVAPFRLARGLQNKVLQAFASGVPVVTSTSGAEGIECTDGQHLLVAKTAGDYLHAIDRLMNEPALYRSLRANALSLARERYSWEGQNKALLQCLPNETDQARAA